MKCKQSCWLARRVAGAFDGAGHIRLGCIAHSIGLSAALSVLTALSAACAPALARQAFPSDRPVRRHGTDQGRFAWHDFAVAITAGTGASSVRALLPNKGPRVIGGPKSCLWRQVARVGICRNWQWFRIVYGSWVTVLTKDLWHTAPDHSDELPGFGRCFWQHGATYGVCVQVHHFSMPPWPTA
jgi:hypothetical protein